MNSNEMIYHSQFNELQTTKRLRFLNTLKRFSKWKNEVKGADLVMEKKRKVSFQIHFAC